MKMILSMSVLIVALGVFQPAYADESKSCSACKTLVKAGNVARYVPDNVIGEVFDQSYSAGYSAGRATKKVDKEVIKDIAIGVGMVATWPIWVAKWAFFD